MKAVVFDKSGTIVDTCRVGLDLLSGELSVGVSSMSIVDSMAKGALLILERSENDTILSRCDGERFLDFCKATGLALRCVYSNSCDQLPVESAAINCKDVPMSKFKITLRALFEEMGAVRSNNGFIYDFDRNAPSYVISTGGCFFPGVRELFDDLKAAGWDVFIATGDTVDGMREISNELDIPCNSIFCLQDEERKASSIRKLKETYDTVVMVGNDSNDILAFREADMSILVLQDGLGKRDELYKEATHTVRNITDVRNVLHI